jgi:hypothetical protein
VPPEAIDPLKHIPLDDEFHGMAPVLLQALLVSEV